MIQSDGKSATKTKRKRNENETKMIFPADAVIGRGKKQLSDRPITAGNIVSFSLRFRFVFVADFPAIRNLGRLDFRRVRV